MKSTFRWVHLTCSLALLVGCQAAVDAPSSNRGGTSGEDMRSPPLTDTGAKLPDSKGPTPPATMGMMPDGGAAAKDGAAPPADGPRGADMGPPPGSILGARAYSDATVPSKFPPSILPVIYLDVPGKKPDTLDPDIKSPGKLRIIEDHDGTHMDLAGKMPSLEVDIGVSRRGSSSGGFAQKSFSIELRDGPMSMEEKKMSVLGLPFEADWALVACWTDKACMRNALPYAMARATGQWSPNIRFVEVYFNNSYVGLYQFAEVIRQDKHRVPIAKPGDMGEDLTGGYMIRREAGGKGSGLTRDFISTSVSPAGFQHVYTYHYPNATTITPAQKDYITKYIASFEEMMKGPDWADPAKGYRAWIDVSSWIDFALMNEVSNNIDGYWKSVYITKDRDANGVRGKLFMTPFWDFNIGFGNADYRDGWKIDNWINKQNRLKGECTSKTGVPFPMTSCNNKCDVAKGCYNLPYVPFYWEKLWSDPAFQNDMKCAWKKYRTEPNGPFSLAFIDKKLAEWKPALRPNVKRQYAKWTDLRKYVWPNPCKNAKTGPGFEPNQYVIPGLPNPNCGAPTLSPEDFFDFEAQWMRDWTKTRLEWLDQNLPGTCAK